MVAGVKSFTRSKVSYEGAHSDQLPPHTSYLPYAPEVVPHESISTWNHHVFNLPNHLLVPDQSCLHSSQTVLDTVFFLQNPTRCLATYLLQMLDKPPPWAFQCRTPAIALNVLQFKHSDSYLFFHVLINMPRIRREHLL